jgi:hypothetical protein
MQLTPGEHIVDTETAVDKFGRLWLVIKCDGETWDRIGPFKSEDELNAADDDFRSMLIAGGGKEVAPQ